MKLIWIPHQHEAWVVAQVIGNDGKSVTVRNRNGTEQTLPGALGTFDLVTPDELETNYNNLVDMEAFNEGIILHQIKRRYQRGSIYTFVGNILIALNPYRRLDIYQVEAMHAVRQVAKTNGVVPPHVFSIGAIALEKMLMEQADQAVLISGESGAGKTETTKLVLQYLSTMAGSTASRGAVSVENQILDSNPLLESFGNAKTVRNNNSSRFGKYMEVNFNKKNSIRGCNVIAYLLEKTRVVMQMPTERNYHSFYMLLSGATKEYRQELSLRPPEQFNYLSQSGCIEINGRDDVSEFEELVHAMEHMSMDKPVQKEVFRVLAGILHLGNLTFQPSRDVDGGSQLTSQADLKRVVTMLGLGHQNLAQGLCFKESSFQAGETIMIPLDPTKACDQRDALAKHIYGRLFDFIVYRVNNVLFRGKSGRSIGVLDIFGFEVFQKNSFEQLCINYCNERLQTFFNDVIFQSEQSVYLEEGIDCEGITFQDNIGCVKLIDARNPVGIFSTLDEEGVLSRPSDTKFVNRLHQQYDENKTTKNEYYSRNRRKPDDFGVKHFAGEVVYNASGFLEKNKDALSPTLLAELEAGNIEFLKEAASEPVVKPEPPPETKGRGAKKGNKLTLSAKFKLDLDSLMVNLRTTNPHFIRCVKPNDKQQPELFDPILSLRQLKYAGLFEAIHIRKAGFAVRMSLELFIRRYKYCCPEVMLALKKQGIADPSAVCKAMLEYLAPKINLVNEQGKPLLWAVGITRVFLKSNQAKIDLEHARLDSRDTVIVLLQKLVRGSLVRSKLGVARREALEIRRKRRELESKETELMITEDELSAEVEDMIKSDLAEQARIEEKRQERIRQERERKIRHWNRCMTKIQKIVRGVLSRTRTKVHKANVYLERAVSERGESSLVEAIILTESMDLKNKDTKERLHVAKMLLTTVQGENYVKEQLKDAILARSDVLIQDAIQFAADSGMTYLDEYKHAKQSFSRELKRRHVLQHLELLLEKCNTIPNLVQLADKLVELIQTAASLNLAGEYFVQDARNRVARVKSLLKVRDNIRKAVELCSVSMMRAAMQERHKHLKIYGPKFCEEEATAVVRMLQMIAHETEIGTDLPTKETRKAEDDDHDGNENKSENPDEPETKPTSAGNEDVAPADAFPEKDTTEEGAAETEEQKGNDEKDENEKLLDLSKNLQESGKQRKNSDSGAPGAPSLEKAASGSGTDVRLPPFVRSQLDCIRDAQNADDLLVAEEKLYVLVPSETRRKAYMRAFKWIVSFATWKYEVSAGNLDGSGFDKDELYYGALGHTAHEDTSRETEVYDVHKAPLKRLKTISTSAGCSFGLPVTVEKNRPSSDVPTITDATRRRVMKRTGGTGDIPSSSPAYIPFSQRASKTDVAASAALKQMKRKGQPADKGSSAGKEKGTRRGAREGDAERAIQQTMKEYQKFVNKHGITKTTAWKR